MVQQVRARLTRSEAVMHDTHRTHGARLWTRLCFVALTAVFLGSLGTAIVAAQAKPSGKTVWDGVYTDAQAERATATFSSTCSRCHTLGADGNRPLSGEKFWEGYTQKTVADLLAFVSKNMPNGQGGTLSPGTYNDLVALILKTNGFPAGTTEVTPETVTGVQIVPKDGPGELPANTLVRIVGCLAPKSGSDWTLTNATEPERIDKTTVGPEDATRSLGSRTTALKFVLSRLDQHVGKRMSVTGLTLGKGGVDGINVSTVNRVGETCP
jgi:mono/diheme cytochrome c family protein